MKTIKKIVSLFEMILVISMAFAGFVSINSTSVSAAPVCCEKTKADTNGAVNYCAYVESDQCAGLSAPTTCDQTNFCSPGCCSDKTGEGFCYSNYPRALCEKEMKGTFSSDNTCKSVNECTTGCCILGNQALFTTEIACRAQTATYPDLKMDFRSSIKTESECLNVLRGSEKGCCVSGENSCSWTTKDSCKVDEALTFGNGTKAGFYKGEYCSQIPLCGCAPANPDPSLKVSGKGDAKSTMCLDNEDSVYWKDSCGNPEGVKSDGKCDYNSGKLCGDSDGNGAYTCESVDCSGSEKKPLSVMLTDSYKGTQMGLPALNGESWCQWDKNVDGDKNIAHASVGSRYYRSVCINGKEFVEPCKDYRQEFCISATVPVDKREYTEAKCVENRGQSCITQCNTAKVGEQEPAEFAERVKEDQKCCSDVSKRDCAWAGKCIPQVSLGFKFDQGEGTNTCSQANTECKVVLRCGGWDRIGRGMGGSCQYEILSGSQCFDRNYLQAFNNICRSYGDCGANYNYEGLETYGGFFNTPSFGKEIDTSISGESYTASDGPLEDAIEEGVKIGENEKGDDVYTDPIVISKEKDSREGFTLMPGHLNYSGSDVKLSDWTKGDKYYSFKGKTVDKGAWVQRLFGAEWGEMGVTGGSVLFDTILVAHVGFAIVAGISAAGIGAGTLSAVGTGLVSGGTFSLNSAWITGSGTNPNFLSAWGGGAKGIVADYGTSATTIDAIGAAAHTAMWIYMIYKIVDMAAEETKEISVKIECKPWEQPVISGKDQCEKCNPGYKDYWNNGIPKDVRALKTCSEYQCTALGATCKLLNGGTGNETCVSILPNDVTSPVIKPWEKGFDERFKLGTDYTASISGIKFIKDVPVYTNVLLALETDKPAKCKMSWIHGKKFTEMEESYFGVSLYDYHHTQMIWVPSPTGNVSKGDLKLQGQGNYTLFIRCQDGNGNANEKDYSISFNVAKEKDLTPPVIVGTSFANKEAFIMANNNKTDVILYTNEISTCRWSLLDQDFNKMPTANQCKSKKDTPNELFLFECAYSGAGSGKIGPAISSGKAGSGESSPVYFRCIDNNKNVNKESYSIKLKGSEALNITAVSPNGDLVSKAGSENVTLSATTIKGAIGDGTSKCRFGFDDEATKNNWDRMVLEFKKTESSVHEQVFNFLPEGKHVFYIGCQDAAGNIAYSSSILNVKVDRNAPEVVRVYKDEASTPAILRLEMNEASTCLYSTEIGKKPETMMIQDDVSATKFNVEAKNNYFVQCSDVFGNTGGIFSVVILDKSG